jgi:pyruvate/2-oxoglutarate dehydrogenase complex dihydrolipoamide dehydrogenase (E3) component
VPQVIFTDPEVAATGLTAAEAEEAGLDARVVDQPLTSAAGAALLRDDADGQASLVVGRVPIDVLRHAVPSYPTSSEIWLRLVEEAAAA